MKHFLKKPAILIFTLIILNISCQDPYQDIDLPQPAHAVASVSYTRANWMGSIDGSLSLAQISIPGTHDSGARHEPWPGTAKCQNLSIAEQLSAGTRFLDIRCRHIGDAFAIHHGSVYQHLNFDDVLNACINFLNANPTEVIIMSVKEEHDPENVTRSFESTFDSYVQKNPNKWYLGSTVPSLNNVRGKIVLMRRFSASGSKGLATSPWQDNTTFSTNNYSKMKIQDYYKVSSNDGKWNAITSLFEDALNDSSNRLYTNFASGYKSGIFGIPDINNVANNINPRLTDYFTSNTYGHYGIIPMDFAEGERNDLIIATNF